MFQQCVTCCTSEVTETQSWKRLDLGILFWVISPVERWIFTLSCSTIAETVCMGRWNKASHTRQLH